ncbi:hypothetical protein EIKCOROL_00806 [Eikenella corrodens ATCC 23834]|uniref:Uncharacterized protein n=1 Tax=Eikenella corrodens ATCC 23834 TaxID=546274 RepID=C0DTX6_EIKCO|nr:hypothetical protein EIKCOROL_00806 [Eikenella corrodens ATCC 23834]
MRSQVKTAGYPARLFFCIYRNRHHRQYGHIAKQLFSHQASQRYRKSFSYQRLPERRTHAF